MPIAIFFVALAGALIVAVADRQLRPVAILFAIVMSALLAYVVWDQWLRGGRLPPRMTLEQLQLDDLQVASDARFVRVSGRAANTSERFRLREFRMRTTVHDCPDADSALPDCVVIAQDDGIARVDVPPGQARRFEAVFSFRNMPEATGVTVWDHQILEVRAIDETARTPVLR